MVSFTTKTSESCKQTQILSVYSRRSSIQSAAASIVFFFSRFTLTAECKCFEDWMQSALNPFDLVTVLVKTKCLYAYVYVCI